jgi:membrane associated rhomboid family serine protease/ribosomal protein L7/L12
VFIPTHIVYGYMGRPPVTLALILTNAAVLLYSVTQIEFYPPGMALDPNHFLPHQLLTRMFCHVDSWHLVGNMWFLWVFGRYVEARLGSLKFLGAYLGCGLVAGIAYLASFPEYPVVGASSAICGLIGFTLAIAPHGQVNVMLFLWLRSLGDFKVAIGWIVGLWIFLDAAALVTGTAGMVAVVSHLAGYATGFGLGYGLKQPSLKGTHWYVEPPPKNDGSQVGKRIGRSKRRGRNAPNAEPEERAHVVVLRALGPDTSPVAVIKLLMKHQGLSPEDAKELVDAARAGSEPTVAFEVVDAAARFAEAARALGVELSLQTRQAPR